MFSSKVNEVILKVAAESYQDAYDKLLNDIIKKFNGTAIEGSPDKNDWINNNDAQNQVYPIAMEALELIGQLLLIDNLAT